MTKAARLTLTLGMLSFPATRDNFLWQVFVLFSLQYLMRPRRTASSW